MALPLGEPERQFAPPPVQWRRGTLLRSRPKRRAKPAYTQICVTRPVHSMPMRGFMRLVDFRDVFLERIRRQASIKELQVHAHGHCIHVGKLSFACGWCFEKKELFQVNFGTECMCRDNCPYCFFGSHRDERADQPYVDVVELFALSLRPQWKPDIFGYNSFGETLLALAHGYGELFLRAASIVSSVEARHGYRVYKKLYTNGLLADEKTLTFLKHELDVDEIRFHLSASMFAESVYRNMEMAGRMGFVVVVEEPSLPSHREQLFEMLPRIEAIGVKHLDICEVEITRNNIERLHALFPDGRMYKNLAYHLYDEGLAYDLIEEVIRRQYAFSIVDCNSDRERFSNSRRDEGLPFEDVREICVDRQPGCRP
jgi:hypothetical protein